MTGSEANVAFLSRKFVLAYVANIFLMSSFTLSFRFAELIAMLGGNETIAGTIVGCGMAAGIVTKLFLGRFIMQRGLRLPWIVMAVCLVSGAAVLAIAESLSAATWGARALFIAGYAGSLACGLIFVQSIIPAQRATEAIAVYGSSVFIGLLAGPLITDALLYVMAQERQAITAMFAVATGTALVYTLLVLSPSRTDERPPGNADTPYFTVLRSFRFGPVIAAALALGACFSIPQLFLTRYLDYRDLNAFTVFFLAYAPSAFCFRLLSRRWANRIGQHKMIAMGLTSFALAQFSYLAISDAWHVMVPALLTGVGRAVAEPSLIMLGACAVPLRYRAVGTAIMLVFVDLGLVLIAPALGYIVDGFGFEIMFLSIGSLLLVISGWTASQALWAHPQAAFAAAGPAVFQNAGEKTKILVTDRLHPYALDYLTSHDGMIIHYAPDCSRDELLEGIEQADVLLCRTEAEVDNDVLDRAEHLKLVGSATPGSDYMFRQYAIDKGIDVFNCPDRNANSVAEFTIGALLSISRNIAGANAGVIAGGWDRQGVQGIELKDRNLGIWGFGQIGQRVAMLADAFEMNVYVFDREHNPQVARRGYVQCESLAELASKSDVLSIHVPLTTDTWRKIDENIIGGMRQGSYIINTSQADILVESDIVKALDSGQLAALAIDALPSEGKLQPALIRHPKALCTPLISSQTAEAQLEMARALASQVQDLANRRIDSRISTAIPIAVRFIDERDGDCIEAHVVDVAPGGLGIITSIPLDSSSYLRLECARGDIIFRVAWSAQNEHQTCRSGLEMVSKFAGLPELFEGDAPDVTGFNQGLIDVERENARNEFEPFAVDAFIVGSDTGFEVEVNNVSTHGLGLLTDRYLVAGTELYMTLNGSRRGFIVRWCRGPEDNWFRCGVQVTDMSLDLNTTFTHMADLLV